VTTTEATMKTGDTGRVLEAHLTYDDGTAIDLTGCTVEFRMRPETGTYATVAAAADVVSPATGGVVRFDGWSAGDIDEAGVFVVEFKVVDTDENVVTVPSDGYLALRIRPGIDEDPTP
jgi:hypothetical protein